MGILGQTALFLALSALVFYLFYKYGKIIEIKILDFRVVAEVRFQHRTSGAQKAISIFHRWPNGTDTMNKNTSMNIATSHEWPVAAFQLHGSAHNEFRPKQIGLKPFFGFPVIHPVFQLPQGGFLMAIESCFGQPLSALQRPGILLPQFFRLLFGRTPKSQ